ncbi:DUF4238 domain-containing protein [Mesorhizobium sp. SEMIA 3007]|uniref:DUF4238 domain-containing protein n=1 Tax=Mesorhizobium sp. SEMIA 3007 TaxID=1862350 RepID=UPI00114CDF1E|nr:DUF4238 domain-containing protein [Mesorhizobium sp. SEMIA 3007]
MNEPKKHHFMPVFYLKNWVEDRDEGRLVQFSRPYGDLVKPKRMHPEGTGYIDRLYAKQGLPDDVAFNFETAFLSPVDSKAADALRVMLHDSPIAGWKPGMRWAWARFMLSMMFRMPEDIHRLKANVRSDWLHVPGIAEDYLKIRRETDPTTFAEYVKAADESFFEEAAMGIGRELMDHAKIARVMVRMRWSIVDLDRADHELLTSDRPLVATNQLHLPTSQILMPVGPRRLFVAVGDRAANMDLRRLSHNKLVSMVNREVVGNASTFVFGANDRQLVFVQNRMGKDKKPSQLERLGKLRADRTDSILHRG